MFSAHITLLKVQTPSAGSLSDSLRRDLVKCFRICVPEVTVVLIQAAKAPSVLCLDQTLLQPCA